MKEIKTNNFIKKSSDLITFPPVPGEKESNKPHKKKNIYQKEVKRYVPPLTEEEVDATKKIKE